MAKVKKIFDEIPIAENEILIFPQKQKDFYLKLIEIRIKGIILPTVQRLSKNREFTQKIIIKQIH
ncbi:hypothetical protein HNQ37_000505 [Lactovum miscens]|uniref:Uncharacterized protein n=1 Tax=Lactovum miscens TaxID=190387 RepID=A0A841C489_9LACT|nr:hypothetical protein [Lactovum miscens]